MPDLTSLNQKTERQKEKALAQWQGRLLPWMIAMPTLLIGAFIFLATLQLNKFDNIIYSGDDQRKNFLPSPDAASTDSLLKNNVDYLKWYSLVKTEEYSINRRYGQGGVLLMSRIYIKYLGFFTGMILAIVGSVFIISKLKEDVTELEGSIQDKTKFRLLSSSPGIVFGLLGTTLMMTTILTHSEINVKDMPLYLNTYNILQTQNSHGGAPQNGGRQIDPKDVDKFNMEDTTSP